jgi:hypothetical protein
MQQIHEIAGAGVSKFSVFLGRSLSRELLRASSDNGSRDFFPLGERQCRLRTLPADRPYATGLGQDAVYR